MGQADCHQRIAAMHQMRGELTPAARHLDAAWALAEGGGNPRLSGFILLSLGGLRYLVGEPDRAAEIFREALRIAEEANDTDLLAGSLVNLSLVLIEQESYTEAQEKLEAALAVCRQVEDRRGELHTLSNIGFCLSRTEDYAGAIEQLEQAAELAAAISAPGVSNLYIQRDIGFCHLMEGDLEEAERVFQAALATATESETPFLVADIRWGLARALRERGDPVDALQLLTEAIAVREGLRARMAPTRIGGRLFGRHELVYEEAIDLLHQLHQASPEAGYDRRAFAIAQQAKARMSVELLAEAEIDLQPRRSPELRDEEAEILDEVEALIARSGRASPAERDSLAPLIARLEDRLETLAAEAHARDPRYAELRYPAPPSLERLQGEILREGELLIDYALGRDASHIWAVTPEEFRFIRLPDAETIEQRVNALLPLLRDYNLLGAEAGYYVDACRPVSEDLLAPCADLLAAAQQAWIVPDGILHYLPFEALVWPAGTAPELPSSGQATGFAAVPFLIRDLPIGYVPGASLLAMLREGTPVAAEAELLALGDPPGSAAEETSIFARAVLGAEPLPVPQAREELEGILALYDPARTHARLGAEATLDELLAASAAGPFDAVHIVAHGILNERRPQYSGLLLAPGEDDDGFVTLAELYGLELPCAQLTLSACSSALGEEIGGEGLVGLTRAFLYAGARNVVSALWEVSGGGTSVFMQAFYRRLRDASAAGRLQALADAKRALLTRQVQPPPGMHADLAHPYFWAPFVLTGAGE
jgi:CHAT domain-containing protein/tetratricopeptide (TPR) repeat protein